MDPKPFQYQDTVFREKLTYDYKNLYFLIKIKFFEQKKGNNRDSVN